MAASGGRWKNGRFISPKRVQAAARAQQTRRDRVDKAQRQATTSRLANRALGF